jgi:hypothetical protein
VLSPSYHTTRLNFFVPVPQVWDLDELNGKLAEEAGGTVGQDGSKAERLMEDQAAFLPLPPGAFDA